MDAFLETLGGYSATCTSAKEEIELTRSAILDMERNSESVATNCTKHCDDAVKMMDLNVKQLTTMAKNLKAEK